MTASNIMTTKVLTVPVSANMYDAFSIVHGQRVRQLPVIDGSKRLVGVITPRSLMKAILPNYITDGLISDVKFAPELPDFVKHIDALATKKVSDLLEKDFVAVSPETSVMEVAALMVNARRHVESVLVVDDTRVLLGIISPWDVFKRLWDYSEKGRK